MVSSVKRNGKAFIHTNTMQPRMNGVCLKPTNDRAMVDKGAVDGNPGRRRPALLRMLRTAQ